MGAYNIYCDESCHLENDGKDVMVLGAVWCPQDSKQTIFKEIRAIKKKHGLAKNFEVKWTKVSPAKVDFYKDLVRYFFENDNLHFRAVVAINRNKLNHKAFNQDHDTWYYKMFFLMLRVIFAPENTYRIFLDIKDTCSADKVNQLHKVLCNDKWDFNREAIQTVQAISSREVELIQLADLLIGALSYTNRNEKSSQGKLQLIDYIRKLGGCSLTKTTLEKEEKFNTFVWDPQEIN